MLDADMMQTNKAEINGRWVLSRPLPPCFWQRIKDAWAVLWGKADAVRFYKQ